MATPDRPNVLVILADDLGFTDPGCFGGEIKTPNIDKLGEEGVRFSDFQASPACSPTRSMLMTGTSAHLAGVGTLREFLPVFPELQKQDAYVGHLTDKGNGISDKQKINHRMPEDSRKVLRCSLAVGATMARSKEMGFVPNSTKAADFYSFPQRKSNMDWERRDERARQRSARKMEAYAGMVENMDWNIGKVIKHLESTGQLDNTIVFFMSDNGAEGTQLEAAPLHRNYTPAFKKYFDNSIDNLGAKDSYCWYGARWAQVGTAPSKLYKFFTHQGGIRVCSLVRYPKWKRQGTISHEYCTMMDIMPTILDAAKASHPGVEYEGRKVEPMLGTSWTDYMTGQADKIHDDEEVTGWEFIGRQALRKGKYKIVRLPIPWGTGEWEMYNLGEDMAEENDLRQEQPEKFEEMMAHWKVYKEKNGIVDVASVETYYEMEQEDLDDGQLEDDF